MNIEHFDEEQEATEAELKSVCATIIGAAVLLATLVVLFCCRIF
jgi:hypothetical protein